MEERKKRWGDHHDAYLVRDIDPFHTYFAYLAYNRADAEVWLQETVDVTDLLAFIKQKNIDDPSYKTTMFHAVLMATAKVFKNRPLMNRFIRDGRFYDRKDIILSFVAKRQFADGAEESLMMLKVKDSWTMDDITRKVVGDVKEARKHNGNDTDDILRVLQKLPPFLLKMVIGVIKWADKKGLLPSFFYDMDPNFSSALLSNLGSIKVDAPYHHLNNFGSNSFMMTVGLIHKEPRVMEDGTVQIRDVMNLGACIDERVADGYYYSKTIRLFRYYLTHPEELDKPVGDDINFEY